MGSCFARPGKAALPRTAVLLTRWPKPCSTPHPHGVQVKSVHMGQMRLVVFVRNDMVAGVSEVVRGSQATGVAGVATNKGGVAVGLKVRAVAGQVEGSRRHKCGTWLTMAVTLPAAPWAQIWDTELCFVNSHLAAHQTKMAQRNQNYRCAGQGGMCPAVRGVESGLRARRQSSGMSLAGGSSKRNARARRDIVKGIRIDAHGMDLLTGYHHVFFMGDLNYRSVLRPPLSPPLAPRRQTSIPPWMTCLPFWC